MRRKHQVCHETQGLSLSIRAEIHLIYSASEKCELAPPLMRGFEVSNMRKAKIFGLRPKSKRRAQDTNQRDLFWGHRMNVTKSAIIRSATFPREQLVTSVSGPDNAMRIQEG